MEDDVKTWLLDVQNAISEIYSYDNISDEIIWTIVVRELPILEKEVGLLLEKRP